MIMVQFGPSTTATYFFILSGRRPLERRLQLTSDVIIVVCKVQKVNAAVGTTIPVLLLNFMDGRGAGAPDLGSDANNVR